MNDGKKRGRWKRMLSSAPLAEPSVVLPPEFNPQMISWYGKYLGMRFTYRKMDDGYHVWRIK